MIINPSSLFKGRFGNDDGGGELDWRFVEIPRPTMINGYYSVVCDSCKPKLSAMPFGRPIRESFWRVDLRPEYITSDKHGVMWFSIGQCGRCSTVWWNCRDWNWIVAISELEVVKQVLKGLDVEVYEDAGGDNGMIIIKAYTRIHYVDRQIIRKG